MHLAIIRERFPAHRCRALIWEACLSIVAADRMRISALQFHSRGSRLGAPAEHVIALADDPI